MPVPNNDSLREHLPSTTVGYVYTANVFDSKFPIQIGGIYERRLCFTLETSPLFDLEKERLLGERQISLQRATKNSIPSPVISFDILDQDMCSAIEQEREHSEPARCVLGPEVT